MSVREGAMAMLLTAQRRTLSTGVTTTPATASGHALIKQHLTLPHHGFISRVHFKLQIYLYTYLLIELAN